MGRRRDPLADFPGFIRAVGERLEAGAKAYGNRSFSRPPLELLGEIEQELLDTAGWAYIAFVRVRSMRAALASVGPLRPSTPAPSEGALISRAKINSPAPRTISNPAETSNARGQVSPRSALLVAATHVRVVAVVDGDQHVPVELSRVPCVREELIVPGYGRCTVNAVVHLPPGPDGVSALLNVSAVALPAGSR